MDVTERPLPLHRRLGFHLGLAIAAVTIANFLVASVFVVTRERETLTREMTRRLLAEANSLASAVAGPLLRHDPELELHPLIQRALAQTPDWTDLVVLNTNGEIEGHRDLQRVGASYLPPAGLAALTIDAGTAPGTQVGLDGSDIVVLVPVRRLEQPVGLLVARASRSGIESTLAASRRRLAAIGIGGAVIATLTGLLLVTWHLRPLGDLHRGVVRLGSGDLATRVRIHSRTELGRFADVVNTMAAGLQSAQKTLIQKERLDRELEIARELQTILLPRTVGVGSGYAVRAHYAPALEVSGDYYDVIPLDEDRFAVVAADVSGKGVPGLVVMSMLRTMLHALTQPGKDLTSVLGTAEETLRGSMRRGMFVTCLYGILDARRHAFSWVSAGHCPPARFGPHGAAWLPAGGKPLGLFPSPVFRNSLVQHEIVLEPGDGLLLYTDGFVEALDAEGRTVGRDPVLAALESHRNAGVDSILKKLLAQCSDHRGDQKLSDDITLLILQRAPVTARKPAEVRA